jgi:hypothetical protein
MGFGLKTTTGIIAGVLVTAALAQASKVFAPLAAALFIIAIVWPVQKQLQSWMPKLAALAITIVVTVAICLGFASGVWPCRPIAGRRSAAVPGALFGDGDVAGRPRHLGRGAVGRALQRRLAAARDPAGDDAGQYHAQLLGDRAGLCDARAFRSREHRAEGRAADNPTAARVLLDGSAWPWPAAISARTAIRADRSVQILRSLPGFNADRV